MLIEVNHGGRAELRTHNMHLISVIGQPLASKVFTGAAAASVASNYISLP